jgi:hypothetical protein
MDDGAQEGVDTGNSSTRMTLRLGTVHLWSATMSSCKTSDAVMIATNVHYSYHTLFFSFRDKASFSSPLHQSSYADAIIIGWFSIQLSSGPAAAVVSPPVMGNLSGPKPPN